ncbi:hypothetical protein [Streptomyces sp. NPDC005805]|uniref:ATP-grasp domain-containing protein n=1 Tax=Streptomyces sp. NPDC005805 TaxID=3157068 RepID=UPI0033D39A66
MSSPSKFAYLTLRNPHDDFPDVVRHLARAGVRTDLVALRDAGGVEWDRYDLLSLRMMRYFHLEEDLVDRVARLAERLGADASGEGGRVVNPARLVGGGLDKADYLPWLTEQGVETVPTHWVPAGSALTLREVADPLPWTDAVVKPTLSARGWGAFRLTRSPAGAVDPDPDAEHPHLVLADGGPADPPTAAELRFRELVARGNVCVQPFVSGIRTTGERSFVFLGGELSHVVRKDVAEDGWIAHEGFGGTNTAVPAVPEQRVWAESVHALLEKRYGALAYARIDALPSAEGGLRLLECELVAPRLFLAEGDAFSRYVSALLAAARRARD